jgi:hypothetical protein
VRRRPTICRPQDRLDLLHKLKEDGLFGAHTFPFVDERPALKVSERPNVTFLDIGAGYGRLPYRLATALEQLGYKRIHMRPKYLAPSVQKHGVSCTHYHLFGLQDWCPSA